VVPVRDDSALLRRTLQYFSEIDVPGRVLITDASARPVRDRNLALVAERGRTLSMGWIATSGNDFQQCATALARVGTPFSIVCRPNEFVLPEFLRNGVQFLAGHPGFSTAMGITASYFAARGGRCYALPGRSVENDSPVVRARRITTRGISLLHGIQRTEHLRRAYELAARCRLDSPPQQLVTLLLSQMAALQGRIRFFPVAGCIRAEETPEQTLPVALSPGGNWVDADILRASLIDELEAAGATVDHARELVERWYCRFLDGRGRAQRPMTLNRKAKREIIRHAYRLFNLLRSDRILQRRRIRRSDLIGQEPAWKIAQRLILDYPQGIELPPEEIRAAA